MKKNLSFLNKFEEDAYQKLISGLKEKVCAMLRGWKH